MTAASRWFASVVGREALPAPGEWADGAGGPWPDVRRTLLTYRDEITATIASRSTQTNEVNRSVYVLTMLALAGADVSEPTTAPHLPGARLPLPVALVEPGCSAGLLMTPDRYDVRIGGDPALSWGDPGSGVHVDGDDRTLGDDVPLAARHVTPCPGAWSASRRRCGSTASKGRPETRRPDKPPRSCSPATSQTHTHCPRPFSRRCVRPNERGTRP